MKYNEIVSVTSDILISVNVVISDLLELIILICEMSIFVCKFFVYDLAKWHGYYNFIA